MYLRRQETFHRHKVMGRYLLLATLIVFLAHCKAIELTFDRNDEPSTTVCAILNCHLTDTSEDPSSPSDLTVLRVLPPDGKSTEKQFQQIVSVDSKKPKVTSYSNDYNINGAFNPTNMFIQIYIKNREYCRDTYACRIRGTSSEGKTLVSTTHIHLSQDDTNKQATQATNEKLTNIMKQLKKLQKRVFSMGEKNKKILKASNEDFKTTLTETLAPIKADIFDANFKLSALVDDASSKDQSKEEDSVCYQTVLGLQAVLGRLEGTLNGTAQVVNTLEPAKAETISCPPQVIFNTTTAAPTLSLSGDTPNNEFNSDELFPGACKKMDPLVQVSAEQGILGEPFPCDMISLGGGWIVIQRRVTGNVNFFRGWEDYKNGFGQYDGDFWLGNEKLHAMTSTGNYELRVELEYNGERKFAHYQKFAIGDEDNNYKLTVMDYDGTAGDSLSRHNEIPFTTKDRDNDLSRARNCASKYYGGWWYINCHDSNLNGEWGAGAAVGPAWTSFTRRNPASFTEMKIRLRLEEP